MYTAVSTGGMPAVPRARGLRPLENGSAVTTTQRILRQHRAMNWRNLAWLAVLVAALFQAWDRWQERPLHPADGVLAPDEPRQTNLNGAAPIVLGRWTLTPRAEYDITARVLGREKYRFDLLSEVAPEDLALGWGPMSDNRVLRALHVSQSARFYTWRPRSAEMPIAAQAVLEHSANTHVIPASPAIRTQLARLRSSGQLVHLAGLLVDGVRDDGARFRTSLTRSDSGAGACEVLLVQEVEIL